MGKHILSNNILWESVILYIPASSAIEFTHTCSYSASIMMHEVGKFQYIYPFSTTVYYIQSFRNFHSQFLGNIRSINAIMKRKGDMAIIIQIILFQYINRVMNKWCYLRNFKSYHILYIWYFPLYHTGLWALRRFSLLYICTIYLDVSTVICHKQPFL